MSDPRPVALITGASRGIGRGIALALASRGFDIAGNARHYDPQAEERGLKEVQRSVESMGAAFLPVPGDISDLSLHEKLIESVLHRFGCIDVLINNAGIAPRKRMDVLETLPQSYDEVMSVNARGPFFLTQKVAKQMMRQAPHPKVSPSILFITSVSAVTVSSNRSEYCLSKAALSQAAMGYAHRLTREGIRVYEIRPGLIETDMTANVRARYDALIKQGFIPEGRWGTPEDVGKAAAVLVSGDLPYAAGAILELSGGMQIRSL